MTYSGFRQVRLAKGLSAALLGLFSVACQQSLPEVTPEEGEGVSQVAGPAAAELLRTLVGRLSGALEQGGPVGAIEFCSTEAIPLTGMVQSGLEEGLGLKRTSFRYRNPQNAPDQAEEAALLYFEKAIQAGGSVPSSYVQRVSEGEFRYYQPLFLGEMCLQCHGEPESWDPTVRDLLQEKYPGDLANGYAAGDFRGVVRVSVPASMVAAGYEG